jgi:hypothetical protein
MCKKWEEKMRKIFVSVLITLALFCLASTAGAKGLTISTAVQNLKFAPDHTIWFGDYFWFFPDTYEFGIAVKDVGGTRYIWGGNREPSTLLAVEYDVNGNPTGNSFYVGDYCDPDDMCYISSDPDIGANDSILMGDYGDLKDSGNLLDIFDDISASIANAPAHRDWNIPGLTKIMGLAYAPEFNTVYMSDYVDIVWGTLTSTTYTPGGSVSGSNVSGLAYIPEEAKIHPPLLVAISKNMWLSIYELSSSDGSIVGIWNGWNQIGLPIGIQTSAGCECGADYLWVVVPESVHDACITLGLEGIFNNVGIQPTSLGNIKAMFN